MIRPAVCLTALLALALAGCTTPGTDEVPAGANLDPATGQARRWHDGATLLRAAGVEGPVRPWMEDRLRTVVEDRWNGSLWRGTDDGVPGDGRAETWAYRYKNFVDDEGFVVSVTRNGSVVHRAVVENRPRAIPTGNWSVDSDDAARIAGNASTYLAEPPSDASVAWILARDTVSGRTVWTVLAGTDTREVRVVVDARSGEVVSHSSSNG